MGYASLVFTVLFHLSDSYQHGFPASWADVSRISSFSALGSRGLGLKNNFQHCT